MYAFQHKEFLWGFLALLPLAVIFWLVLRWKGNVKKQLGDPLLIESLTAAYAPKNFVYKFILLSLAIVLCIIAAANLRQPVGRGGGNRAGVDVMVALDVSNSMLAQDVKPNRLERAKQVLNKIMEKMGDNRLGLVVFAGQAYLQMPLTADLTSAKMYVSNAAPNAVPMQGTVVADALRICNNSLDTKEKKYKTIILISDGETHDEKTAEAIKELEESGVVVHTVGIGSPDGSPIFDAATNDYKKDENGNTVISKLNEKDLQNIAASTKGQYVLFSNADEVSEKIVTALDQMEKKQLGSTGHRQYASFFQYFLLAALALLVLEIFIPEIKMKWL